MEALVNAAYDRISEDVILLYDAFHAYEEVLEELLAASCALECSSSGGRFKHTCSTREPTTTAKCSAERHSASAERRGQGQALYCTILWVATAVDWHAELTKHCCMCLSTVQAHTRSVDYSQPGGPQATGGCTHNAHTAITGMTDVYKLTALHILQQLGSNSSAWSSNAAYGDGDELEEEEEEEEPLSESGLREVIRVLLTSILSDLAVLPFWTVKISAVAQRGRLPQLWPFQGYTVALSAILKDEGVTGLFKGAVPCTTAAAKLVYSDLMARRDRHCVAHYHRRNAAIMLHKLADLADMHCSSATRNRQLYSDYYWKTTHRLTARLVMKDAYSRHMNDPEVMAQSYEGLISRVVWALVLHPFDLIATRMITESSPRYATFRSSIEAATK
eukprot:15465-Heterococcus_DN1.PRE.1